MLGRFVGLRDARDDQILRFARRWGMLELCSHSLPIGHNMDWMPPSLADNRHVGRERLDACTFEPRVDRLADWRYWSSQARAILEVGRAIAAGRAADPRRLHDLLTLAPWADDDYLPRAAEVSELVFYPSPLRPAARRPISSAVGRQLVADALDYWFYAASTRLAMRWSGSRPEAVWTGGLIGMIGLQLALAVSSANGWAVCAGCGSQHVPARPNSTRRSFCPTCREEKGPTRLAQRDRRARLRRGQA
jgi:hypothetical protein